VTDVTLQDLDPTAYVTHTVSQSHSY